MAKCGYCGSTIVIGGVRAGNQRFCNNKFAQNAYILSVTKNVPNDVLERKVEEIWRGNCPKCRALGPVMSHQTFMMVWSALVLTRWTTKAQVSCHSCAAKGNSAAIAFSFFFGWWGFPWGLVLTPVQITRNIHRDEPWAGLLASIGRPAETWSWSISVVQMIASQKAACESAASDKVKIDYT